MTFAQAIRTVLSKYATFTGRASRPEYWWWTLFVFLVSIGLSLIDNLALAPALGFEPFQDDTPGILSLIFSLAVLVPGLAVSVRRLHDIGRSGWWLLIVLVPVIGFLVLLWWAIQPGEEGPNRYGPPTSGNIPADATF